MLGKVLLIVSILIFYIVMAAALLTAVATGVIQRDLPQEVHIYSDDSTLDLPIARAESIPSRLSYAQTYMNKYLVRTNGHVELYVAAAASTSSDAKDATANNDRTQESVSKNNTQNTSKNGTKDMQDAAHPTALTDRGTNSEAASYYLLWTVQANDKTAFDRELAFIDKYMQHPTFGYMMWRLTPNATVQGDGENIATDADLRAIKALLLAEKQWGDEKYTKMIDELASGLEKVGVTKDGYLAPYGGVSGETSVWVADEVWLSYADFTVFRELSTRRGMPWTKMYTL
ncbi:MAG TPA: glycosyl hydrolase family 8, partial [Acidobacteriota bacterium]|nr:glycosyl hydrolase family 8 [Acidobacteriota bacterium]